MRFLKLSLVLAWACLLLLPLSSRSEVLIQWFETEWDEIYRRLPEMAEEGYEGLWVPPPTKSPNAGGQFAGGGNVGYSHYDKFDIGDVPQRGSLGTRYGTRGSLRNMVDNAHQCDIKIYPDIVMNHFGNGPDYRTYPGTQPNDFHGWWDGGQPGGFKRTPRMTAYDDINNGYGYTFQQELVSLIDLQLESDGRFNSGYSNFSSPPNYYRQPGWDERYPFGVDTSENTIDFIHRWINWLGYAMDWDGVRLDAPKHVIADFFGTPGNGFNHQIQWNFQNRRGYSTPDEYADLYKNYVHRKNALIFSEFFIGGVDQVSYWRTSYGVKFRYLDFPRKSSMIFPAFNSGNLAALSGSGFSEEEGVLFCQSHDESPPSKLELAYVYILTHIGLPVVYFTGNNLNGSDVNVKTWLKIGHGGALGDYNNNALPNLVYIHNQFARGREWERWSEGDIYIYERYDDLNISSTPNTNEGLLLVGLNDSGGSRTANGVLTAFAIGTVLHDYTGNYTTDSGNITVYDGGGGVPKVNLPIPAGMNGQGWVCFAPRNASANGDPLRFSQSGASCPTMNWVVPGGALATNKPRTVTRITNDVVDIDVYFNPPADAGVDSVIVKWGNGLRVSDSQPYLTNDTSLVSYGYQNAVSNASYWRLTATLTNVAEGLHLVKGRCFNARSGYPALFQTFSEAVYVDRHGPALNATTPAEAQTVDGDLVAVISNSDRTAYSIDVQLDGGGYLSATKMMEGSWRYNLSALSSGNHTMVVRALEADWGASRSIINTSYLTRTFSVDTAGPSVSIGFQSINRGAGAQIELPFFRTIVTAAGLSQNQVTLLWDGLPLVLQNGTGSLTNVFDGRYVLGNVTGRLYGAFVNGAHFFEAVAVSGILTNRASTQVTFNLYGSNQVDSDGDGLPDNVEMPNFSNGTSPGPNVPWPGDNSGSGNQDMIPNYGETWTRLNPMNADSDYDGLWDGDEDSDYNINSGDGVPNSCEVRQGYLQFTNAYYYNLYDGGSKPGTCVETNGGSIIPSSASWTPTSPTRCAGNTLTITYARNQGPLSNESPIQIYIGYSNWSNATTNAMTDIGGGSWQYIYAIPTDATNVNFVFRNTAGTIWDNNGGADWAVTVGACVVITNYFNMDGNFDNANYEVANSGMKILAAVKGSTLYVATWSANGSETTDDHFLYVCSAFSAPEPSPWAKSGQVFFDKAAMPHLVAESKISGGFCAFNNSGTGGRVAMGTSGNALEGELNLTEVFGEVPSVLYIAAVAMGDNDGGGLDSQCPPSYGNNANDLETTEFQPVPVASIRDEDLNGTFDIGKPQMWTVVNGNTNDANYGLRRMFLNERAGDSQDITVILNLNGPGGTNVLSDVELFSNLNRRDFAVLPGDQNPDDVTTTSETTYYRAYPMSGSGSGPYTFTINANKCGAYRINARYKVNHGAYVYYSDGGLRRDCAVVASPKKALDLVLYEMNPMTAEATSVDFYGRSTFRDLYTANTNRPDVFNTNSYGQLGVNMVWLQPIHPIGSDNKQTDPETLRDYDPGSPYAVRNYWTVSGVLGDPWTADGSEALAEFTNFVQSMDGAGVGVMLDGTFNHSAWDCEIGEVGVQMFPWATNAGNLIRDVRPQWYSRAGNYGTHATYYRTSSDTDMGVAPDRIDFGKWSDVADFFFGTYDALVQGQADDWRDQYLHEQDVFDGFATNATRELWQYFSYYPIYWLEKTGHPQDTPKAESFKGIDGLRCDFAQGLPSLFWEYTINKTRSVKWDFIFMAESLDGYREVGGSKRHGLSYRSARHFDVLNENMVFYWRDNFFNYYSWNGSTFTNDNAKTYPTWQAWDNRRNAYDAAPILLNLTSHDELYPNDDQWRVIYAYATVNAMDGAPMLFYGQEAGAQNDAGAYGSHAINPLNNFARYETNFGKAIPNFKRYNNLTNIWDGATNGPWKPPMYNTYRRINWARQHSPALRSQNNYMLGNVSSSNWNPDMFVVAKFEQPGVSAASQDVVFVAVNNNYQSSEGGTTNRIDTFIVNTNYTNGKNWFGIEAGRWYNLWDLMSVNPTNYVWTDGNKSGTNLLNDGLTIWLHDNQFDGRQAQYLKLVDVGVTYPDYSTYKSWDKDNDNLPDAWETANGLDPNSASGDDGTWGDKDQDGMPNYDELQAATGANDSNDVLQVFIQVNGSTPEVSWPTETNINYRLERTDNLAPAFSSWQSLYFGTALSATKNFTDSEAAGLTSRFYRVKVQP
ncbi:MAG: alpha-amylase family glycosyl hydrolase [Verrucomicrobiota bacterium]